MVQFPNFHKLSVISLLAAVMSLGYSTIAIGIAGHQGKQPGVVYNMDGFTTAQGVFGCKSSSPKVSFDRNPGKTDNSVVFGYRQSR